LTRKEAPAMTLSVMLLINVVIVVILGLVARFMQRAA
jgi:hypothetical protein